MRESLSVFDLNIMHGRNNTNAAMPPGVPKGRVEKNLDAIVELITKHDADVVTLQEVDEYSVLSGGFNQVEYLGARLAYPYFFYSSSCALTLLDKKIFHSGNMILSKYPLENCAAYRFEFSFPTERQGFVIADVDLGEGRRITVASVHLVFVDWMHRDSRVRELALVENVLKTREHPRIISGDFNCTLGGREESLRSFVERLELTAYDPKNERPFTHRTYAPTIRVDWILASQSLRFISYETLPDVVSDHFALVTKISIGDNTESFFD